MTKILTIVLIILLLVTGYTYDRLKNEILCERPSEGYYAEYY